MRSTILPMLALAAAATLGLASPSWADWQLLGTERVDLRPERDVIHVTDCTGPLDAIRVKAVRNGIQLRSVKVHLGNGQVREIACSEWIPAGRTSSVMDLPGRHGRNVTKVVLHYETEGCAGRPAVAKVFGLTEGRGHGSGHGPGHGGHGGRSLDRDDDRGTNDKPVRYREHHRDRVRKDVVVKGGVRIRVKL